eukprot:Skav229369  [mRNA]  locus=scaffold584:72091:74583:- [translate_table: standard]
MGGGKDVLGDKDDQEEIKRTPGGLELALKEQAIRAATGICDIDQLVQNFIDAEDTNFSLFKYNNELSAEIEKLEQQIAEFKEECPPGS